MPPKQASPATPDAKPASTTPQTGTFKLSGEIGKKYKLLVQILTSDPRFVFFVDYLSFFCKKIL